MWKREMKKNISWIFSLISICAKLYLILFWHITHPSAVFSGSPFTNQNQPSFINVGKLCMRVPPTVCVNTITPRFVCLQRGMLFIHVPSHEITFNSNMGTQVCLLLNNMGVKMTTASVGNQEEHFCSAALHHSQRRAPTLLSSKKLINRIISSTLTTNSVATPSNTINRHLTLSFQSRLIVQTPISHSLTIVALDWEL